MAESVDAEAAVLLDLAAQPTSMRACNELLVRWVAMLQEPRPTDLDELSISAQRRLGYIAAAARRLTDLPVHASWTDFEKTQARSARQLPEEPFLSCDPEPNPHDELAHTWGLTRGVRLDTFTQICRTGSC